MPSSVDEQPCPHRADEICSVCAELQTVRNRLTLASTQLDVSRAEVYRLCGAIADYERELVTRRPLISKQTVIARLQRIRRSPNPSVQPR